LKLARQPYCRWLAAPVSDRELEQAHLMHAPFLADRNDPEFGYRLVGDEARAAGHEACDRTMWRLCACAGWRSVFGKRRPKGGKLPGPPAHDDLVLRNFTAAAPDRLWLIDITEHPVSSGGKRYLCAIKDVWSNRIVEYSTSDRMTSQLAVDALTSAVTRRGGDVVGCSVDSDRGLQFRSRRFLAALRAHGLVGPMGRAASAGDNAAMESFFPLLQNKVLNRRRGATRTELRLAIITRIERTYHRRRRQARLGRMTPTEYEMIMTTQTALAARDPLSPTRAAGLLPQSRGRGAVDRAPVS
jgi:transposase InsO family protein